nr:anti-sigma factor [Hufsiella ginkgonis]
MAARYPAVREELTAIEEAFEKYAAAQALTPAGHVRSRVLAGLTSHDAVRSAEPEKGAAIVAMPRPGVPLFYKYAFAASVALLAFSWSALFVTYNRLQDSKQAIVAMQASEQKFTSNARYMQKQLDHANQSLRVLHSPDYLIVTLAATPNAPKGAQMKVAFNPKAKEVMIDLNDMDMPANDTRHQYQLWALVDGKPVDLGVFDKSADSIGMLKMKEIARAQTFAVTLEPKGGSVNPTMDRLMVAGNI